MLIFDMPQTTGFLSEILSTIWTFKGFFSCVSKNMLLYYIFSLMHFWTNWTWKFLRPKSNWHILQQIKIYSNKIWNKIQFCSPFQEKITNYIFFNLQNSHIWIYFISWWRWICCIKLSFRVNALLQKEHWKWFSPEWVRICLFIE